jgi:hypothetical protein
MAEVRGTNRLTIAECDGEYTTVGFEPIRNGPGITDFLPEKLSISARKSIRKLMSRCEEVAKGYIPSNKI